MMVWDGSGYAWQAAWATYDLALNGLSQPRDDDHLCARDGLTQRFGLRVLR
jgi:hypothetical protein